MSVNLFEMKAQMQAVAEKLEQAKNEYQNLILDTTTTPDQMQKAQELVENFKDRAERLQAEYSNELEKQKAANKEVVNKETKGSKIVDNYANLIRNVMRGQKADYSDFKNAVLANTSEATHHESGDNFFPVNVSSDIITEPQTHNPLREGMATITGITNLVLPRIAYDYGDKFGAIADGAVAKEIELNSDQVEFGRFKSKVRVGISETVLAGANTDLVKYANDILANGVSDYELRRALATTPATKEEHMSLYHSSNKIKTVKGESLFKAIKKAIADLDDTFADKATVLMSKSDYYDMIETLANGSTTLYAAQPEQVLGVPVKFTNKAVKPIVGDFSNYVINYEPQTAQFERYKNFETGIEYMQVTYWADSQIKLASAFRIVEVEASKGK